MPSCSEASWESLWMPQPAMMVMSQFSPTWKVLYTTSFKPDFVTMTGMYTVSPLVPSAMRMSMPGLSVLVEMSM